MADTRTINKVAYSAFDTDTAFDALTAEIQTNFANDYNDFSVSSLGIMLVDIVANATGQLSFYLDRRASESYLSTALVPKSVTRLTKQLGYKMRPASASSTDLDVRTTAAYDFPITIAAGFQFAGPNSLIFQAAQDVTIPLRSTSVVSIPVYEGETVTETFVSDGTANQEFGLRAAPAGKFIVAGTAVVTVDGTPYTEQEFLAYGATTQFEVTYSDFPPILKFGDNIFGRTPTAGASIVITYVVSRGLQGQVGANTITSVVTPLVVSFTTISLIINNPLGSSGGDDPETISQAKAQAGKFFKARQVAVTQSDYETLSGAYADPVFGRVAVAKAIPTRTAVGDVEIQNQSAIISASVAFKPTVDSYVTAARTKLSAIDTDLTNIQSDLTNIGSLLNSMKTIDLALAQTQLRAAQQGQMDLTPLVNGATTGIIAIATAGVAEVNAITTHATDSRLTLEMKDILNSYFNRVTSQANIMTTGSPSLNTVLNQIATALTGVSAALARIDQLGVDLVTADTILYDTEQSRADIQVQAGVADLVTDLGVRGDLANIQAVVLDVTTTVGDALTAISVHMDAILAADCKVNLITVPILTKNFSGFYASPSSGLIRSLQNYLDNRKEVTQTVKVVSGKYFLIAAVMTIRLGVNAGFSQPVLQKTVSTVVDGVLRERKFGADLYLSDLISAIKPIEGVGFVNVTINGHLQNPDDTGSTVLNTRLDIDDNLIVQDGEVITKGVVTIDTELVVA